ncbi:MAG: oligogalacturonate lyase family protein [Bacteroidetes bacterium]|nr:oligogalacturonate lyase family protein [Bacteroidota bacterium]
MKRLASVKFICVLMILLMNGAINSQSNIGKIFPSEMTSWVDSTTGYEITKWTNDKTKSWHLYFNIESFIDNDNAIIFSERGGNKNLFILNFPTGQITQITDEEEMDSDVWHLSNLKTLWYLSGNKIKSLNTETYKSTVVTEFEGFIESFTVSSDGKYIVYALNKNPGFTEEHSTGPYAIFKYNIETKETEQVSPDYGFIISHLQANPVNPNIVMYCWQHRYKEGSSGIVGNTPQRIWWLNINQEEGGPVGIQEFGIHRTHEFWFPNGEWIGYSARYIFGSKKGQQFLGCSKFDGSDSYKMPAPVLFAHSQMYKDNKHWVADYYDGMNLVLFTVENREITHTELLFKHDSSWEGQPSHPHPHFSPDGKRILFSTDKSGVANVYSITLK